ncbi:Proline iminopeptidase [Rhodococcus wratislaviensis]|uniref:Proline iminopeptidase n=1 Tax=Rhodococcus wratislaviensis TaxID=44752 RepID=A0A402CB68_RHOWR|nr:prolyl aminopeptidase [Rhodococcus wratislaviensis]GCE40849.1 Proline iminopeptidase [Rhodococcus wratislaviensis]
MGDALYPAVEPYEFGFLDVSDGHHMYWETIGTPTGIPVVYLHGGPGSGSAAGARRYFDPTAFRAVLFDQRGCGRSRPLADGPDYDLGTNTTGHLVDDIERLREHLGIERWIVTGVSWGVSLGLVYAQKYPERVIAAVFGAITAGTRTEIDWITRAMGRVFPQQWAQFVAAVPEAEQSGNLAAAYACLLADPDPGVREIAAVRWCAWEDTHVSMMPGWRPSPRYDDPIFRSVFARLVTHYWAHDCFLAPGQILDGMCRLAGIPAILVHGRFDVSGPLDTAWKIAQAWPGTQLLVLEDAGHGGGGFAVALATALDSFNGRA